MNEQGCKILIIDDNAEDCVTFRYYLEKIKEYRYDVFEAELGDLGIEICRREKPDCILLDYNLPDGDGLSVMREINPDPLNPQFAVVLLTGSGNEVIAVNALKNGAQDYLVKGEITPEDLHLSIQKAIESVCLRNEKLQALEDLRKSKERLSLLIESASDYAIFTLTLDSRIDSWNKGTEKVFGWTEKEALGQPVEILFTPEDRESGAPELEMKIALEKGSAPVERFCLRRDGSRFYVSGVTTLLKDGNGKVKGFAKIARDMSEQIKTEKALRDKEILQRIVGAQEDERKRIARNLHDELGQQLTALRFKLDAIRKVCDDEEISRMIDETQLIAQNLDNGVDFLAWELRPAALDDLGLIATLDHYVKQWSYHSGITAELLASSLRRTRLAPEVETNLYRIAQEALNNTHKHAKAKSVEVILEKRDKSIVLIIEDNGIGFNPEDKKKRRKGMGLIGMRERAALIDGTLEIESAPQHGTTIYVQVPAFYVKTESK